MIVNYKIRIHISYFLISMIIKLISYSYSDQIIFNKKIIYIDLFLFYFCFFLKKALKN